MDEYQSLVRETFVVRLWREATHPAWRGHIVHLPDQESVAFTTLAEAEDFIHRFAPDLPARPRLLGDNAGMRADPAQFEP